MKISDYVSSHGLSGHIKLPRTGETLHFSLPKGEGREYVTGEFAGHTFEGYLELAERPGEKNDDIDRVLVLVLPGKDKTSKGVDPFANHSAYRTDLSKPLPPTPGPKKPEGRAFERFPVTANEDMRTARFDEVVPMRDLPPASPSAESVLRPTSDGPLDEPLRDYVYPKDGDGEIPNLNDAESDVEVPSKDEIGAQLDAQGVKTEKKGRGKKSR